MSVDQAVLSERVLSFARLAETATSEAILQDALMQRVWPGRIVEENTLEAQIAAVRRALDGDRDLVRTVAGRGYQFVGEIAQAKSSESLAKPVPGLPAAVFQPLRFQPASQVVIESIISRESVTTTTFEPSGSARRPSSAAVSSMRLLVVRCSPPEFPVQLAAGEDVGAEPHRVDVLGGGVFEVAPARPGIVVSPGTAWQKPAVVLVLGGQRERAEGRVEDSLEAGNLRVVGQRPPGVVEDDHV